MTLGWCNAVKGTGNGLFGYPNVPCIFTGRMEHKYSQSYAFTKSDPKWGGDPKWALPFPSSHVKPAVRVGKESAHLGSL